MWLRAQPHSETHWCDVSAARRVAASHALSTIAASLARSGWLRADAIRNAFFNKFFFQTETVAKITGSNARIL